MVAIITCSTHGADLKLRFIGIHTLSVHKILWNKRFLSHKRALWLTQLLCNWTQLGREYHVLMTCESNVWAKSPANTCSNPGLKWQETNDLGTMYSFKDIGKYCRVWFVIVVFHNYHHIFIAKQRLKDYHVGALLHFVASNVVHICAHWTVITITVDWWEWALSTFWIQAA